MSASCSARPCDEITVAMTREFLQAGLMTSRDVNRRVQQLVSASELSGFRSVSRHHSYQSAIVCGFVKLSASRSPYTFPVTHPCNNDISCFSRRFAMFGVLTGMASNAYISRIRRGMNLIPAPLNSSGSTCPVGTVSRK